jgi:hypothetical protein
MERVMEKLWNLVREHPSVLVIVIGASMLLVGAAGRIPLPSLPLEIRDPFGRIGLSSAGFILMVSGVVLMWREFGQVVNSKSKYKERAASEGIRSPIRHYMEEEND